MTKYIYDGPVVSGNVCVANNWHGETYAISEDKAKSNMRYQFNKQNNKIASTNVILPGKIREA